MSPELLFLSKLSRTKERYFILLCLILGLIVIVPILDRFVAARIFLDIFLTAIVITMVYTISHSKGLVIAGLCLALVIMVSSWSQYFIPNKGIAAVGMITGNFYVGLVISCILSYIIKSDEVNLETIYEAILLYLLAALWWAFTYAFLELVDPGSFNIELDRPQQYLSTFQYYSFVTITTLGYGDIAPISEVAKAFSILEAVVGQLYLVVAVAWLVGMHVSSRSK